MGMWKVAVFKLSVKWVLTVPFEATKYFIIASLVSAS
jgi:hypothetical protein